VLKNITLSADEQLIRKAREKSRREHTTLNKGVRLENLTFYAIFFNYSSLTPSFKPDPFIQA